MSERTKAKRTKAKHAKAKRLVVIGGGFAGLWAAASAARLRDLEGLGPAALAIALVAPDPFHVIRVRCYEDDLSDIRVPLDDVLAPIGVTRHERWVEAIDPMKRVVTLRADASGFEPEILSYDSLVLASGSALVCPDGIDRAGLTFDVDTYAGAERLAAHIAGLGGAGDPATHPGRWTAVIVGAGLVGIELACELGARIARVQATAGLDGAQPVRVILVDRSSEIGASMGAGRPAIRQALAAAKVELRAGVTVQSFGRDGVILSDGEVIACATTILATGQRASPLAAAFPVPHDAMGRVLVDDLLAVEGIAEVYAAGDVACARTDTHGHFTVMSCQHARAMGRLAGHNAACHLLGRPQERIAFAAPDYVTILDLGDSGAVYTSGWDRSVLVAHGAAAKETKMLINRNRIYPPRNRDRAAILKAAAPLIQLRPSLERTQDGSGERMA